MIFEPVISKFQLQVGDIVHHDVFGNGKIISQRDDKEIVRVYFNDGEKDIRVEVGNLLVLRRQEEEIKPRIRWFKDGKLAESKNKEIKMNNLKDFDTFNECVYRQDKKEI
jgi:hypothetical protein